MFQKEQSQGEEMKLKTSHEETIEKTSKLTAKESTTSLGHTAKEQENRVKPYSYSPIAIQRTAP